MKPMQCNAYAPLYPPTHAPTHLCMYTSTHTRTHLVPAIPAGQLLLDARAVPEGPVLPVVEDRRHDVPAPHLVGQLARQALLSFGRVVVGWWGSVVFGDRWWLVVWVGGRESVIQSGTRVSSQWRQAGRQADNHARTAVVSCFIFSSTCLSCSLPLPAVVWRKQRAPSTISDTLES